MTKTASDTRHLADLLRAHRIFGLLSDDTQKKLADTLQAKPVASGAIACTPAELQRSLVGKPSQGLTCVRGLAGAYVRTR
jgi:hypothetical protein